MTGNAERKDKAPWKPTLALVLLWIGTLADWDWMWGVLFLMWTAPAFVTGSIYLVENVERRRNPKLFWLILATWLTLSVLLIVNDILKLWGVALW